MSCFNDIENIEIVEILQRGNVINELEIQQSKYFNPEMAAKLGKQVGATIVVLGSVQVVETNIRVTIRFVNVESGRVNENSIVFVKGKLNEVLNIQSELNRLIINEFKKKNKI